MQTDLHRIRQFVGAVEKEQLRYIDSFVGGEIAMFLPSGGPCYYALSPMHSHPSYMFVLPFNDQTSVKIGKRIITAAPGKLFCLSPGVVHNELPSDYPPRYIAILIAGSFFERQLSLYPAGRDITFSGESYHASPELLSLLKRFMTEARPAFVTGLKYLRLHTAGKTGFLKRKTVYRKTGPADLVYNL